MILQLNGLSYHVYNHDAKYSELRKTLETGVQTKQPLSRAVVFTL